MELPEAKGSPVLRGDPEVKAPLRSGSIKGLMLAPLKLMSLPVAQGDTSPSFWSPLPTLNRRPKKTKKKNEKKKRKKRIQIFEKERGLMGTTCIPFPRGHLLIQRVMIGIVRVVFQIEGHASRSKLRTGLVVGCGSLSPQTAPSRTSGPYNPLARVLHTRTSRSNLVGNDNSHVHRCCRCVCNCAQRGLAR